jgi:putative NADH-flavin reductase
LARANCKIPRTGASGYIGGDLLYLIAKRHPEYGVTALVRNTAQIETISRFSNNVQVVQGTLDDEGILEKEASEADIVLSNCCYTIIQIILADFWGRLSFIKPCEERESNSSRSTK